MEQDPLIVSLKQKTRATPSVESPRVTRRFTTYIVFVMLTVLCGVGGYYGYLFVNRTVVGESGPRAANEDAGAVIEDTIARVSELIVLPEGEEPTIATVTDPEKLKDQEFFKNARVGYRVLLYTKARKAYLYDPEAHRLIEVAPITTELQ